MTSCLEVSRRVSEGMDRELPLATRLEVRRHLLTCPPCKRYEEQLYLLRDLARRMRPDSGQYLTGGVGLSPEARERIRRRLFPKSHDSLTASAPGR